MTYSDTFPQRFTKIDDLTREDHSYLTDEDECYFIGEYTARQGYTFSATNDLIINFKKPVNRRGKPEWKYKERAIREAATAFGSALGISNLGPFIFVPMPPSKSKDDCLYDDRLVRMLDLVDPPLESCELIWRTTSVPAAHESDKRPRFQDIIRTLKVETSEKMIAGTIAVVDDMLTTGVHFKAAKQILTAQFSEIRVVGLFLARRAPETENL